MTFAAGYAVISWLLRHLTSHTFGGCRLPPGRRRPAAGCYWPVGCSPPVADPAPPSLGGPHTTPSATRLVGGPHGAEPAHPGRAASAATSTRSSSCTRSASSAIHGHRLLVYSLGCDVLGWDRRRLPRGDVLEPQHGRLVEGGVAGHLSAPELAQRHDGLVERRLSGRSTSRVRAPTEGSLPPQSRQEPTSCGRIPSPRGPGGHGLPGRPRRDAQLRPRSEPVHRQTCTHGWPAMTVKSVKSSGSRRGEPCRAGPAAGSFGR